MSKIDELVQEVKDKLDEINDFNDPERAEAFDEIGSFVEALQDCLNN